MTRRLFITDHYDSHVFRRAAAAAASGDHVDVLLLGLSPAWFRWQYPSQAAALQGCRLLEAVPLADAAHALVRTFVVDYVARLPSLDLGGDTLERLLADVEEGNGWWYLETSEKGPYRGPLIGQLYRLAIARVAFDQGGYSDVSYSLRDARLVEAFRQQDDAASWADLGAPGGRSRGFTFEDWPLLRYWVYALASLWRVVATWCLPQPRESASVIGKGRRVIFTAFPAWWSAATSASPRERFFSSMDREQVGGYLALVTSPGSLWRHRGTLRAALESQRILFLQQFLSVRDAVSVLAPWRFRRLWRFERRLRGNVRVRFAEFEVGHLIARDITRSLSGGEMFQDVLLARAVRRAVARLAPSMIVYRAEFQPAENALLRGSEGRTIRIGFVHFPFGEKYLPTQFAPGEVSKYLGHPRDPDCRPMPDGFIASGEAIAEHVTATGFPKTRVELCGPLRYDSLVRYRHGRPDRRALRERLNLPLDATVVFVALAIVEADTEALFGALVEACGTDTADLRFLVRTHPNRPAGDRALETTLASLGASRASLVPAGASIYDYIAASDAMVCIGSMIAFEAMALGVMPIVFDNPATYGAVSLAEYGEGLFAVRSAGELRAAIHHVVRDTREAVEKRQAWPHLLSRVFGDLDRPAGAQFTSALDALAASKRCAIH